MPRRVHAQDKGRSAADHVRSMSSRWQSQHTYCPISCTTSQSTFSHIQCIHSWQTSHCTHGSFISSGREQQTRVRSAAALAAAPPARTPVADLRCRLAVRSVSSCSFSLSSRPLEVRADALRPRFFLVCTPTVTLINQSRKRDRARAGAVPLWRSLLDLLIVGVVLRQLRPKRMLWLQSQCLRPAYQCPSRAEQRR